MFPGYVSDFLRTDPKFIECFDNFAFDEVIKQDGQELDDKTRWIAILATLIGCQGIVREQSGGTKSMTENQ